MNGSSEGLRRYIDRWSRPDLDEKTLVSLIYILDTLKNRNYDSDLTFSELYKSELSGKSIEGAFQRLARKIPLFSLFLKQEHHLGTIPCEVLAAIFNFVHTANDLPNVWAAFAEFSGRGKREGVFVPDEVSELAMRLVATQATTVYAPFTQAMNIAYSLPDKRYFLEDRPDAAFLTALMKEHDQIDIEYRQDDPLSEPSYLAEGASHRLRSFDAVLCFPPFNMKKFSSDCHHKDRFHRFRFFQGKGNLEIPAIEHVLAQLAGKAAVLLPIGLTFRGGVERDFRQYLLEGNFVDGLIQLPSGIIEGASIETALLILDNKRQTDNVYFLNTRHERFNTVKGRRSTLSNIVEIVELYERRQARESIAHAVSLSELKEQDYNLSPDRYIETPETKTVSKSLSRYSCKRLDECFKLRRSQAVQTSEDGEEIHEISPGDLPDAGYTQPAGRIKKVDTKSRSFQTYSLKPGDVLLSSRGTIGKVGIVGEDANFIASQSFVIIRPKEGREHSKYLYLLLKSEFGKNLLKKYAAGTLMPQIPLDDLEKLEIPWPSEEQISRVTKAFEKEMELSREIEALQKGLENLRNSIVNELEKK